MTHDDEVTVQPAVGTPVDQRVVPLVNEGTALACKPPRKVETHFTYGYRMHCPDCKHSEESWWD